MAVAWPREIVKVQPDARSEVKKASRSSSAPRTRMEEASFDEIYERYGPTVFRRARTLLRDPDRALDATQEVFLRAVQHRTRMSAHPLPWLFRVTTNLCLTNLRDDRRRGHLCMIQPLELGREGGTDARLAVNQVLARVPEDLQQIAISYYVDDLSHEEIAATFGLSRRTIGNRLAAFHALADDLFRLRSS